MRILILVFLSLFVINACTKDKAVLAGKGNVSNTNITSNDTTTTDTIPLIVLSDSVLYVDIQDTILQSVQKYDTIISCRPIPSDSLSNYRLDVTDDGVYDLTFSCKTIYNLVSVSNPCANYDFQINIEMTGSDGIIASPFGFIDTLSYNRVIDENKVYKQGTTWLKINSPVGWFCWPINQDYYIGFKVVRNGITMYGWVLISVGNNFNSVTIKSFAINRRNALDITAGQIN